MAGLCTMMDICTGARAALFRAVVLAALAVLVLPAPCGEARVALGAEFVLYGECELRSASDFRAESLACRTLNHEGGLRVRALFSTPAPGGEWLRVLTMLGLWADSGDWIPPYSRFYLFLPDNTPLYDYERLGD